MPQKTYVPGAVNTAQRLSKYLDRYQVILTAGFDTEQLAAYVDLVACLATFLSKVLKPPPNN
jgi:hypothetical protein